ncbi:MAG: nitroreductase family deazaflavin-dependent oxidoreductase [Chloroflexi bacterium]|nr:nitroreductase family deazaflavin-dependent oxidoreductase [Chloroflexota bacterium]
MGQRFLMLTTTGRVSGQLRNTVIEVVSRDLDTGVYYVASAWGVQADWLRNLQKEPLCNVQVGGRRFEGKAERLQKGDAQRVLLEYARKHPKAMRGLAAFMGFEVDGSDEAYRQMAATLPLVGLRPLS